MFKLLLSFLFITSISFAQLFDWTWQNPFPTGADYNDALIINANNFMLFGNGGKFLKSTDGGNSWSIKSIDAQSRDIYSATFINESMIYVVGTSGLFMKTTDGGETWTEAYPGVTVTLWDVEFANANLGVAVGASGKIIRTTDGGNAWTESTFGTSTIYKAHFINENLGYIGSASATTGRLIKTTNGGESWFDVSASVTNLTGTVRGIHFINENLGWISNSAGRIFKTTDAGTTWTQQTDIGTTTTIYEIKFVDADEGLAITTAGRILKTTNGGTNWATIQTTANKNLFGLGIIGIQAEDRDSNYPVLVGGDAGVILISSNGGTDWNPGYYTASQEILRRAHFPSTSVGYAVGGVLTEGAGNGHILKTTDAGNTWTLLSNPTTYRNYSVYFTSEDVGYVAHRGSSGMVKTTDGGNTWQTLNLVGGGISSSTTLYDVAFVNDNLGLVAASTGYIGKTTDAGATWSFAQCFSGAAIYSVHFATPNVVYAVGPGGRIGKSTDAGSSWTQISSLTTITLYGIYFFNADNGFITGSSGKIYKTTNGGSSFSEIASGSSATFYSVAFFNDSIGWVAGSSGNLLYTEDGGNTWNTSNISVGTSQTFYNAQIKSTHLWLVGSDGMIIKGYADPQIPVELTSFTASANNKKVTLCWSTATETNNKGFEIERSNDKHIWKKIGFINGHGTVTEPKNYSFEDLTIINDVYYYRLKQVDFNGDFTYSNTIEVTIGLPEEYSLSQNYPNPFNPVTTIKYTIPSNAEREMSNTKLMIFDVLGRAVVVLVNEFKEPGTYEVKYDASRLTSGVYFYRLISGSFIDTKKMMLLR